jgi:hypothetical protein
MGCTCFLWVFKTSLITEQLFCKEYVWFRKAFKHNFAFVFVHECEKVPFKKKIKRISCAMVFDNAIWGRSIHWVQVIIKSGHILSYNFECLGMSLILVQVPKKITPQEYCGVWPWGKFVWTNSTWLYYTMVFGHGVN